MTEKKKWTLVAFWILLGLGVYAGSLRNLGDADIWFQLLAGKYALTHGVVPQTDFFIYSSPDAPQQFGGWGFGVVYELVIRAFGLMGTTFFNSLIWTAAFFFAVRAAMLRVNKGYFDMTPVQTLVLAMMMSVLFMAASNRMSMRAESTLVLAWTFSLWLFEHCKTKNKFVLFWIGLPLVGLVEAWLHTGGFVLLVALPICASRIALADFKQQRIAIGWVACSLALIFLPMLNPNGPMQVYTQLLQILSTFSSGSQGVTQVNLEYLPMWDARSIAILPKYLLICALYLLLWVKRPTVSSVVENLACLTFLVLAGMHNRGISLVAMMIMVPALQLAMSPRLTRSLISDKLAFAVAFLLCASPIGSSWTMANFTVQSKTQGYEFEVGLIKKTHPQGAHILTVENGPGLAYALGDERFMVSKGGHALIPNAKADKHQAIALNSTEGWEKELIDQKVDFVCLPLYLPLPGRGVFYWLPSMLASSPDWKMHVGEGPCNLFERLPNGTELSKQELAEKTMIYLRNMAIFAEASFYGQPDTLGQEIGRAAQAKIKKIEAEEAADKEKLVK